MQASDHSQKNALLEVKNLTVSKMGAEKVDLLHSVNFEIFPNETLALVGESGSGKTLSASAILGLFGSPKIKITDGQILFHNEDLAKKNEKELLAIRGSKISYIPQNPMNGLNPTLSIGFQLGESIKGPKEEKRQKALEMLSRVGIGDAAARLKSYPHELSGGMRQRVLVAMSLLFHPSLVIADEPTTALDVTIQAQILDLLAELKKTIGMSLLFITHDLGIVSQLADRVAVMFSGQIIETATVAKLFQNPLHPYTKSLLDAAHYRLKPGSHFSQLATATFGTACPYAIRCPHVMKICLKQMPPPFSFSDQTVCCWRYHERFPR